jgi:hypothetical protein
MKALVLFAVPSLRPVQKAAAVIKFHTNAGPVAVPMTSVSGGLDFHGKCCFGIHFQ